MTEGLSQRIRRSLGVAALLAVLAGLPTAALACGMMLVAPQETKLVSSNSKVVIALDQKPGAAGAAAKVALTIAVDYHGAPKEFAAVIPVPTFIERKQIGIVDMSAIDRLDALTAPRLTELDDRDPCAESARAPGAAAPAMVGAAQSPSGAAASRPAVTVEANYDVGEYDVSILSATESTGLVDWLNEHGYKMPPGAAAVLGGYMRQGMRFFVAKVNLARMPLVAGQFLRPLQVRYETSKPMLPIRLGMVNANGPQELVIFALSRSGRVEVTNYDTVEMPSRINVPLYVKQDFGRFYNAVFDRMVAHDMASAYLESAVRLGTYGTQVSGGVPWNVERPTVPQLIELGARWIGQEQAGQSQPEWSKVIVTRLRIRYDAAHFPEDLKFTETNNGTDFRAVYFLHHAWKGSARCAAAEAYRRALPERYAQEARDLARITGWPDEEIRARMAATGEPAPK